MGSMVGLCDLTALRNRNNQQQQRVMRKKKTSSSSNGSNSSNDDNNGFLKPGRVERCEKAAVVNRRPPSPGDRATVDGLLSACSNGDEFTLRRVMVTRKMSGHTVNMMDGGGRTALSHVCSGGNISLLDLLLLVPGVDANLADNEGHTPLHHAASAGHSEVISRLLHHFKNLDVDAVSNVGLTALMKAALQGKSKCVRLLLNAGASPILRDTNRGLCASEWANFTGRHQTARLIEAHMKFHKVRIVPPHEDFSWDNQLLGVGGGHSQHNQPPIVVVQPSDGPRFLQRLKAAFQRHLPGGKNNANNGGQGGGGLARNLSGTVLCSSAASAALTLIPFAKSPHSLAMVRPTSAAANLNLLSVPKVQVSNVEGGGGGGQKVINEET